jgi:hypothetical protein
MDIKFDALKFVQQEVSYAIVSSYEMDGTIFHDSVLGWVRLDTKDRRYYFQPKVENSNFLYGVVALSRIVAFIAEKQFELGDK